MSRDVLVNLNYLLVAILLIGASIVVMHFESPERLIQGEWVETAWRLEKDNVSSTAGEQLQAGLRKEILQNVENLHLGVWRFDEDGTLQSQSATTAQKSEMEWIIKGRGHVLELRRAGKTVESFQIQQISKDRLVLHLNFDLQVKGIIEIVLERKERTDQYAKKI